MTQHILNIENLSAGYGKEVMVDDVSFSIDGGEVFGLVGLNGAGKTTLIKTILGLIDKKSGHLSVSSREDFSYLPERFDPPWFLSGYEFISFSLRLYKQNITKEEAREAATRISLNPDFLEKRVHTYSKGMRQKLGLLATFLTQAPILILDEPMSGLDPKARRDVKKIIQMAKEEGRSVFMTSHVLADIAELCDRVAVFHDHTIIFTGTPKSLLDKAMDDNMEDAFLSLLETHDQNIRPIS